VLDRVLVLNNTTQEYAWGSRTAIPELLGLPSPSREPQAELWMGAHPKAPSRVTVEGREVALDELIRLDPGGLLGSGVAARFGAELPFLFKIIAAAAPLSIQVHPTEAQARRGFRRENEAGIPLDALERNYRDPHHKPEVLYSLGPFWAMCGFRPVGEMLDLLRAAAARSLADELSRLAAEPSPVGLRRLFTALMDRSPEATRRVVEEVVRWAAAVDPGGAAGIDGSPSGPRRATPGEVRRWVLRLHEHYPGDAGVLAPLLLNLVELRAGEVLYLDAGTPHAYLEGLGVELMANSDNVLRGGLTPKHVDVRELLRTLRFASAPVRVVQPVAGRGGETLYPTPAREFLLAEVCLQPGMAYEPERRDRVEILLCVSGAARLAVGTREAAGALPACGPIRVQRGTSLLVPAAAAPYRLVGEARLFKATVP
jgi:mannose-6-phosphate isomerase